jgi:hypothetical protein
MANLQDGTNLFIAYLLLQKKEAFELTSLSVCLSICLSICAFPTNNFWKKLVDFN